MAAHAIGADQHQCVNRIARRLLHVGRRQIDALGLRVRRNLLADLLFGSGPVAVERGDKIAARTHRPVRLFPGCALRRLGDVGAFVLQRFKEGAPLGFDRRRIGFELGVEVFDVGGVAAVKKRSAGEGGVGVLTGHRCSSWRGGEPRMGLAKPGAVPSKTTTDCSDQFEPIASISGRRPANPTLKPIYDVVKSKNT